MNHSVSEIASTLGKTARRSPVAHALFLGLAFLWSGGQAMADSGGYWLVASDGGISGVEVVVTKNPGGIRIVAEDAAGNSALRLDGPGDYTVSSVCRKVCPPHSISGTVRMPPPGDTSPPIIGILVALLLPAQKAEGAQTSFNFTIKDARTVVLSGVMPTTPGTVKPALDVDGNGQRDAVTDGLLILRRSGIANAIEPQPENVLPGAAISTSRSNIKRPGIAVGDITGDGVLAAANGKHITNNDFKPGITAALQNVSTTRGTAPGPGGKVGGGTGIVPVGGVGGDQPSAQLNSSGGTLASEAVFGKQVQLEGPGSIKVSTMTGPDGAFSVDKLPAGEYKLKLVGLPDRSLTVATDGIAGGKVMRGNDGSINIFDRWGTLLASSGGSTDNNPAGSKVAANPGFEPPRSGFAGMGGGGPGILPDVRVWQLMPGSNGPVMSPSPMGPGPMGAGPAGPGAGAMRR